MVSSRKSLPVYRAAARRAPNEYMFVNAVRYFPLYLARVQLLENLWREKQVEEEKKRIRFFTLVILLLCFLLLPFFNFQLIHAIVVFFPKLQTTYIAHKQVKKRKFSAPLARVNWNTMSVSVVM